MSGLFEKKVERDGRREERLRQEQKEKRRSRSTVIIVVAVLAVLFVAALILNSGFIRRTLVAVTIDGVSFTAAEYDYFYRAAVYEYQEMLQDMSQQMGTIPGGMMPSDHRPHASQIYDPQTGETWADFFRNMTFGNMSDLVASYNAARRDDFVMPDEVRESIEESLAELRRMAESSGFSSFSSFLRAYYETPINEKTLRDLFDIIYTANSYRQHVFEALTYTPEQLENYYNENRDTLDVYTYRYFIVKPEEVQITDYENTDDYEEAQAAAFDQAMQMAMEIAGSIASEEDFINAAREYDPLEFDDDDSTRRDYMGEILGGDYGPWLREAEREYGDVTVTVMGTSGIYVVFFVARNDNNYYMRDMRQILTLRDQVNIEDYIEDAEAYEAALAEADNYARERAEAALELFIAGGATEELLVELMADHSDDWTEGGLYTEISRYYANNQMIDEVDQWLFDPSRQIGDFELVRTEAYGYHLLYLTAFGERYSDFIAEGRMRENDYREWGEELIKHEAATHWALILSNN